MRHVALESESALKAPVQRQKGKQKMATFKIKKPMRTLGHNVQLKLGQGSFENTITDGKIQDDTLQIDHKSG